MHVLINLFLTCADLMLGKNRLAELREIARKHELAAGSQTIPNSVVEVAIIQGRSPPQDATPSKVPPAPRRKKLVLKKTKRKQPQAVQEDEDDEDTEDGLVFKRKRVAPSLPPIVQTPTLPPSPTPAPAAQTPPPTPPAPAVQAQPLAVALPVDEGGELNFLEDPPSASTPHPSIGGGPPSNASAADAAPGGDEGAHNSPIIIPESPPASPHQTANLAQPAQEGGGESQQQALPVPPAITTLPLSVQEVLGPFGAKLKMMAEDFPRIIAKVMESSSTKLQDQVSAHQEENRLVRLEAEKLSCTLLMTELNHTKLKDAMDAELRVARKEASDLRQRLQLLSQEKIGLEGKLVPYRVKVADLEEGAKAGAVKVANLEKRSAEREVLLGKVEKERDDIAADLAKARDEHAAALAQTREEHKKVADDLVQARGEIEELKKRNEELAQQAEELKAQNGELTQKSEELEQSSAQILAAGFDAAREQVVCQYPELDVSMVSICNEVVDGKVVPIAD